MADYPGKNCESYGRFLSGLPTHKNGVTEILQELFIVS